MRKSNHRVLLTATACSLLAASTNIVGAQLGVPLSSVQPLNGNAAGDTGGDYYARLATDGLGHWVAVWRTTDSLGGTIGTEGDILVARSIDNGANWSSPVPLNTNAGADTGEDSWPVIATDGQGHWVAAWQTNDSLGGAIGSDGDILVARSVDNGANWSPPAPLNANAADDSAGDSEPAIATDRLGNWVCVWNARDAAASATGNDGDILVARSIDNGANWSLPIPLNSNATTDNARDWHATVATDGNGNWICAWEDSGAAPGDDDDIFFARSINAGASWSARTPLNANASTDSADDLSPSLACAKDGHCVAVWNSYGFLGSDSDIIVSPSLDGGQNWSLPTPLNANAANDSGDDGYPNVATDSRGNWVCVWDVDAGGLTGSDEDIFAARSIDDGAHWSLPGPLNTNAATDSGEDILAQLATDGQGSWVAVWPSNDSLGGTIGGDDDILTARFALPDCNNNLIADSTETLLGLLPDINFNSVPDLCEIIEGPPPGQNGGCGVGLCGAGATTFAPLTLLGFAWMRGFRRRRSTR